MPARPLRGRAGMARPAVRLVSAARRGHAASLSDARQVVPCLGTARRLFLHLPQARWTMMGNSGETAIDALGHEITARAPRWRFLRRMDTVQATADGRHVRGQTAGNNAAAGRNARAGCAACPPGPVRHDRLNSASVPATAARPPRMHGRGRRIAGPAGDGVTATQYSADTVRSWCSTERAQRSAEDATGRGVRGLSAPRWVKASSVEGWSRKAYVTELSLRTLLRAVQPLAFFCPR